MLEGYARNEDGLIYQVNPSPITYDPAYVETRYNTYGELNVRMSLLRYGFLAGAIGSDPLNLLDVGYGNGAFLDVVKQRVPQGRAMGYDVSGYPIPHGALFVEDWRKGSYDVVTFFDVLEHFEDPYIIKDLDTQFVYISLPLCHYDQVEASAGPLSADRWFENWKHRRPNEHLWHFNHSSMTKFARRCGYEPIAWGNIEDIIRKPETAGQNIMSVILRKGV